MISSERPYLNGWTCTRSRAGAGSGKTRVITYRIAYLVSQGVGQVRFSFLSNKQSRKGNAERVIELIGSAAKTAHLSTFHALGLRFLRDEYKEAGLSEKFTILDEGDQLAAIIDLMREVGYDTDEFDPKLVHGLISHYKSRLEDPTRDGADLKVPWHTLRLCMGVGFRH